ncbi:MAG: HyaD/HybD family hydrogenase maturation endopeptidase [Deltaproteobacteria bacterium]|nr:HyaD/HybD family hydrogenase maturation endopeptidase [Deltaproteobacteria bacterium]MBW2193282.1 HyaD/HybD family hydrogenase maturation endopeptidase [Deltaproteobacteria bacterium]
MSSQNIVILGIGNILFCDEGFGVRVIERLFETYDFPENVSVVDGGVLGMNLLGVMCEADHLIVVDAIKNKGKPGTLYRFERTHLPERIRTKSSLHEVDFLEALTMCHLLDNVPETVIVGVEPEDIDDLCIDLTEATASQIDPVIDMVLKELDRLGVKYKKGVKGNVSGDSIEDCKN